MKIHFLTSLMLLIALTMNAQTEQTEKIKVGDAMPAFTIKFDDGRELSSAAFKGKVVLVNFFATWCPPCQKELAAVEEQLWPKYKDNADFALLVIGREHTDAELLTYNEKKGFAFPLYPDGGRYIFDLFAFSQIPRTYLIGKNGKVLHASVGYTDEEFASLLSRIDQALKK